LAGKYLGMLFAGIAALLVLVYFYAKMWYHLDIIRVLLHGDIGRYL
jgi:hypothetical protein